VNDTDQTVLNFSVRQTGMNPDEVIKKRVQDLAEKMFGAILSHDVLVGEVEKLKDEYKQLDTKFIAALGYCATAEEQRREEVRKLNAQIEGLTAERDHYRVALSKAAAGPWIESSVERPNEYGMYFIEVNYLDYVGHFGADDMKYYDERGVSHYPDKYRWARINAGAK